MNTKKITLAALKIVELLGSGGVLVTVPVPETGATFLFLTIGLATVAALRRKLK